MAFAAMTAMVSGCDPGAYERSGGFPVRAALNIQVAAVFIAVPPLAYEFAVRGRAALWSAARTPQ
jgi:hypothetical protein